MVFFKKGERGMPVYIRPQNKIQQTFGDAVFDAVVYAILILLMLFFIYPFYNCLILAFNDGQDAKIPGIYFWPRVFTLDNFTKALQLPGMGRAAVLSILRTFSGTLGTLVVTGMFGYVLSKKRLLFSRFYVTAMMIPMFFGGGLIPTFLLIRGIGLYDNFLVYILPSLFNTFYCIIFMASFREVPASLEESAMLDGATQFSIFFRIIVPVSKPVFAALGIFTAVGHWNSWMDTMIYTRKEGLNTLAYMFSKVIFQQQYLQNLAENANNDVAVQMAGATSTSIMVAAMVLSTLPITIIYPFFQKYFAKGVLIGSIKG
jgi:putative aldouronate transport system permease protein